MLLALTLCAFLSATPPQAAGGPALAPPARVARQSRAERDFDAAVERAADLDRRLDAVVRRAISQADPAAHAALAYLGADLKRDAYRRELFLGTGRTSRFVVDEILRTREAGYAEPLVHVALAGADADLREAAARALDAVGDPEAGRFLLPHLDQDRALALAARFPHRALLPALVAALGELNRRIELLERVPESVVLDLKPDLESMKARRRRVHDALVAVAGANIGGYDENAWREWAGR